MIITTILTIVFVLVALLLVFVVLIQSGKGGGLAGGAFGGLDSMGSVFGGRGSAPFLTRLTTILVTLFMFISLLLGMITRGGDTGQSLVEQERERRMAAPSRTLPEVAEPMPQQAMPMPAPAPTDQQPPADNQ